MDDQPTLMDPIDFQIRRRNLQPLIDKLNVDKQQMHSLAVKTKIELVKDDSSEGSVVNKYFAKSIKDDYRYYGESNRPVIDNIWSIRSPYNIEKEYRMLGYHEKEQMLLWHGTRPCNVVSILDTSFRKPEKNNLLFGPGIYFGDRAIKSMQYTWARPTTMPVHTGVNSDGQTGYFFLCQVATGNKYEVSRWKTYREYPKGYDSIKALGVYKPDPNDVTHLDNIVVPWGETQFHSAHTALRYNEYIVYTPKQVLLKFLVQFTWINI